MLDAGIDWKRYLFVAVHRGGGIIAQTQADLSLTRPGGSRFSDVEQETIETFHLYEQEPGSMVPSTDYGTSYSVDLRDGHFEANGARFAQHIGPVRNLRLRYWRHRSKQLGGPEAAQPASITGYQIGWDGEVWSEDDQAWLPETRVLEIDP